MCQGLSYFSCFLHYFVMAKIATSSIRVLTYVSPNCNFAHECLMPSYNGNFWSKSNTRLVIFDNITKLGPLLSYDIPT